MRNILSSQELFAKNIEPDTVYSIEKNKYEIRMVRFWTRYLENVVLGSTGCSEVKVDGLLEKTRRTKWMKVGGHVSK